jgi:hypothetical protein
MKIKNKKEQLKLFSDRRQTSFLAFVFLSFQKYFVPSSPNLSQNLNLRKIKRDTD